jgi:hypothetical protein
MIKKYRYKTETGEILNVESIDADCLRKVLEQMIENSSTTIKLWDEKLIVFIGNARKKEI